MSIYGGFGLREQESRYNITLFDLVLTLSARVYGTLKNRSPDQFDSSKPEFKFLVHVNKLHKRLVYMEAHKRLKPLFSQAADRLNDKIVNLIGPNLHENSHLNHSKEDSASPSRPQILIKNSKLNDALSITD